MGRVIHLCGVVTAEDGGNVTTACLQANHRGTEDCQSNTQCDWSNKAMLGLFYYRIYRMEFSPLTMYKTSPSILYWTPSLLWCPIRAFIAARKCWQLGCNLILGDILCQPTCRTILGLGDYISRVSSGSMFLRGSVCSSQQQPTAAWKSMLHCNKKPKSWAWRLGRSNSYQDGSS